MLEGSLGWLILGLAVLYILRCADVPSKYLGMYVVLWFFGLAFIILGYRQSYSITYLP